MLTEKELIHPKEKRYLIIAAILGILTYLILAISISGIIILLIFGLLSLFSHGLMLAHIRTNGVRISSNQFPEIYEKTLTLCEQMELKTIPDIYVMQSGGIINAFAARFFGRNMVVLYSEIFELLQQGAEEELIFIIAHELAHIKRRHLTKQLIVLPVMWIPFLGNAYFRACELSCDRFGAFYTGNPHASKNSLIILAIGKKLYHQVNQNEFIDQIKKESGFFIWLSQKVSTHPPLPLRIEEIKRFENGEIINLHNLRFRITIMLLIILGVAGLGYGINYAIKELKTFDFSELSKGEKSLTSSLESDDNSLISAVTENDSDKIKTLLRQGSDVNEKDSDGWTALDWSIQDGNIDAFEILLDAGADINSQDSENVTPLMIASSVGDNQMIQILLTRGAKLDQQDIDGYTPLIYAVVNEQTNSVELLLDKGANSKLKDNDNFTPLMYAIKNGNQDIINLLRSSGEVNHTI